MDEAHGPPPRERESAARAFRVQGIATRLVGRRGELERLYEAARDTVNHRRARLVFAICRCLHVIRTRI